MSKEMDCDFYFGDSVFEPLKQFEPAALKGFKGMLHAVKSRKSVFVWHKGIRKLMRGYSDYLITGQYEYLSNWILILFAKLTGKHIFCWSHGAKAVGLNDFKSRMLNQCFFRSMDGVFMYGSYNIPTMKKIGITEERIHIIHNSLDTDKQAKYFDEAIPSNIYRQHFGNNSPTVIYIGRIQKRKKLDLLIEAIRFVNTPCHRINLVIVGAATNDRSIEEMVSDYGMQDAVWFYGPCYDEALNAELIYNADVCVCPAEVGLTAIHALSYGTPVISNNDFENQMPEFEAIQEGVTGGFYKAGDCESLAEQILSWTSKNSAERQNIRRTAHDGIERAWSVAYQIDVLQKVFPQYVHH